MNSFILRVRNFPALAGNILKSEAITCRFCAARPRTLFTSKNCLISVPVHCKKYNAPDVQSQPSPSITEQNLGKIVDLDVDFDDVKIDCEEFPRGRKRRISKEKKLTGTHVPHENAEETDGKVKDVPKSLTSSYDERNDSLFSSIMTGMKSSKFKEKNKKILLEGKRLIHDAISAGFMPEMIFYTRKTDLEKLNVPKDAEVIRISYKSCKIWTDVVTPQGIFGVFQMPALSDFKKNSSCIPLTIICDNIREPGNLGTILRVGAGVGCKKIILSKGCVNLWDSKVLRAGAGAHFHIPIQKNISWSDIETEISEDSKVFLADLYHQNVNNLSDAENEKQISPFMVKNENVESLPVYSYSSVKYVNEDTVLVIGGETQGLCREAFEFAARRKGARVFIPLSSGIESLNNSVALGILAYEFKRQLSHIDPNVVDRENADSIIN